MKDHRHKLYREYLRILARHAPPVFIMENVKGILSSELKGNRTFLKILEDLQYPAKASFGNRSSSLEYKIYSLSTGEPFPEHLLDYVIRSEKYGIPQKRHRVILLGVRSDISATPEKLSLGEMRTVEDAIGHLPRLRSGLSKMRDSGDAWTTAVDSAATAAWMKAIPGDVAGEIIKAITPLKLPRADRGKQFIEAADGHDFDPSFANEWFVDARLGGCCNHETRGHIIGDLHRYLFAACFAKVNGTSPKIADFPKQLFPKHENVLSVEPDDIIFADRFRVQLKNQPATTVVSHIARDGHYYIHYDPSQCRSLSVREAARLQTFPDNYFFEGSRTKQYSQVGNAVPPLLARQIAEVVAGVLGE